MPTRDTAWPAGTPCWADYGAASMDEAQRFYGELFGWSYTEGDPEYAGYVSCLAKDLPAAGMGPLMDESMTPSWTTYFATDDAAATAERITSAGGTVVVPPMQVGPMGTMVVALDPEGNAFGAWQSGEHTGARIYNEPGAYVWNEAAVDDIEAAKTFYAAVFGLKFDALPEMGGYLTFSTGGDPLGGMSQHQPGLPKGWSTCFAVADTDGTAAALEAAGGKVAVAPADSPYGRYAVLQDPWGAGFSVMQLPSS
ncbi:MAG TPA: VOC family protein [Mycobacteriales bacterium]|nr:VOC family protein [Mycobacteriales bacterium]